MIKRVIICMLCISFLLFASCNSREDVKHSSQDEIINYVADAIGEDISLVGVEGSETDPMITYTFMIDTRNVTFTASSVISALFIDGSQFGNYGEEIYIKYEEGIAESEQYIAERLKIAEKFSIEEVDNDYGSAVIEIKNYNDIDRLAQYTVAVDHLYGFKEDEPDSVSHIGIGVISFNDIGLNATISAETEAFDNASNSSASTNSCSIDGPLLSTNEKNRLKYEHVYDYIVSAYVTQMKQFNLFDRTIPDHIWNSYDIQSDKEE